MRLWEDNIKIKQFDRLEGDTETDVLIIGGGITGVLCAYLLKDQGIDPLLVEAERIGKGTTAGTTAVVTAQHSDIYTKLVKQFDQETAKKYLQANMEGFQGYRELAKRYEFDFEEKPSYIYSLTDQKKMQIEAAILKEIGAEAEYTEETELPMRIAGAVRFPKAAQMHPLKLLAALAEDLRIKENTKVIDMESQTAYTETGKITANKIIVATHYPILKLRGLYPLKLYQKRSFVVAVEHGPKLDGTYSDVADRGIYLRNYGDLLLVGGGDCRTGTCNDGFRMVREFVKDAFPDAREVYAWAAQDCISLDEAPYIGLYCKTMADVYVATGFNEWGMTTSMAAAKILTDEIMEKKNEFADVFAPDRSMMRKQLAVNVTDTVKNFLTPTTKRCSHLGCALKKNVEENTWDCPCHGSRFDEQGCVIDNPALKDI